MNVLIFFNFSMFNCSRAVGTWARATHSRESIFDVYECRSLYVSSKHRRKIEFNVHVSQNGIGFLQMIQIGANVRARAHTRFSSKQVSATGMVFRIFALAHRSNDEKCLCYIDLIENDYMILSLLLLLMLCEVNSLLNQVCLESNIRTGIRMDIFLLSFQWM